MEALKAELLILDKEKETIFVEMRKLEPVTQGQLEIALKVFDDKLCQSLLEFKGLILKCEEVVANNIKHLPEQEVVANNNKHLPEQEVFSNSGKLAYAPFTSTYLVGMSGINYKERIIYDVVDFSLPN